MINFRSYIGDTTGEISDRSDICRVNKRELEVEDEMQVLDLIS